MSVAIARARVLNTLGLSKWVFGPYVEFDGKGYILAGEPHLLVNNILSGTYCFDGFVQVDPTTVCYSTGRKDKTGKDIYIGDVVRLKLGRLCKVVWFEGLRSICVDLQPIETDENCNTPGPTWDLFAEENLEVVGNIVDNPEFYKGGNQDVV